MGPSLPRTRLQTTTKKINIYDMGGTAAVDSLVPKSGRNTWGEQQSETYKPNRHHVTAGRLTDLLPFFCFVIFSYFHFRVC